MAHKLALCGSLKPSLRSHWLFLFGLRNVLAFLCSFVNIRMNCHCVKICIQRLHRSLKTFRDSIFLLLLLRNENLFLVWNRFIRFWVAANAEIFCQVPCLLKYFLAFDGCGTVVELIPREQEVAGSKSFQSLIVVGHLQTVRLNIGLWLGMIDLLSHFDVCSYYYLR